MMNRSVKIDHARQDWLAWAGLRKVSRRAEVQVGCNSVG